MQQCFTDFLKEEGKMSLSAILDMQMNEHVVFKFGWLYTQWVFTPAQPGASI
jgi:hypothetical protein